MSNKERIRIRTLLIKMLQGELSEEEQCVLEEWGKVNEVNQQLIFDLKKCGAFDNWQKELSKVNVPVAWQRIEESVNSTYRSRFRISLMRYAAVIIVALFTGSLVYYFSTEIIQQQPVVVSNSEVKPGSKKAELVLSNGDVLKLGETKESIRESDGTEINNEVELLAYASNLEPLKHRELLNEIRVRRGEEFQVKLSDGTMVWINSMTTLRYPVRFMENRRVVEILEGEVCFDVTHDDERPFIVKTPVQEVRVLGTKFNVSCYSEDATVKTTLLEGKVSVENNHGKITSIDINPNQQYIFNKKNLNGTLKNVDASSYMAWINGRFHFEDEPLEEVFKKLRRWYNIDVFFVNSDCRYELFTGHLPRFENIDVILKMIEQVSHVSIQRDGNVIKIN